MKLTRRNTHEGYSLIELMIVVAIIGILVALAVPSFQQSAVKAREAALKQNLHTIRTVLDQHYADKGFYPPSLETLVEAGYLRQVPMDPFTEAADAWVIEFEENPDEEDGMFDVHSSSDALSTNGTPYNEW